MSAYSRHSRSALARRDAMHSYSMHFGPNMTPMVDIVMVILIFFMATAAFMGEEWFLRTAIPFESGRGTDIRKSSDPLALPPARLDVILDVDRQGRTLVTFQSLHEGSIDAFIDLVRTLPRGDIPAGQGGSDIEVTIRPTGAVPYRDIVRSHSALDAQGIRKVGIQVRQGEAAKKPAASN